LERDYSTHTSALACGNDVYLKCGSIPFTSIIKLPQRLYTHMI